MTSTAAMAAAMIRRCRGGGSARVTRDEDRRPADDEHGRDGGRDDPPVPRRRLGELDRHRDRRSDGPRTTDARGAERATELHPDVAGETCVRGLEGDPGEA